MNFDTDRDVVEIFHIVNLTQFFLLILSILVIFVCVLLYARDGVVNG